MEQDQQSPGGLLDGAPDWLKQFQAMAAQFGPSESDQKTAKMHSIALAGLLGLANWYTPPSIALGIGGAGGMQNYNDELQRIAQQRQQGLQSVAALMPIMMQANQQKMFSGVNFGGRYGDTTTPAEPAPGQAGATRG